MFFAVAPVPVVATTVFFPIYFLRLFVRGRGKRRGSFLLLMRGFEFLFKVFFDFEGREFFGPSEEFLTTPTQLGGGKRARGEPAATNIAADLAVVNVRAQWWSSDLKPQMAALPHQMVEGSDEAVSA